MSDDDMDPRVFQPAGTLYNTVPMMNSYDTVTEAVLPHESVFDASPYCWRKFESKKDQKRRMRFVVERLCELHPGGSLLVCSHGGPCTAIFEELTGSRWEVAGPCGYTALSLYEYELKDGTFNWKNLCVNDTEHVGGTLGGIVE